ncbi:MAG: hypothetical protein GC172_07220, partial [Phycisphaera sp.]|nr:hypothetical protein [Phycisphaera sp.]
MQNPHSAKRCAEATASKSAPPLALASTPLASASSTTACGQPPVSGSTVDGSSPGATASSGPTHAVFQPASSSISTIGSGSASSATSGASASVSSTPFTRR